MLTQTEIQQLNNLDEAQIAEKIVQVLQKEKGLGSPEQLKSYLRPQFELQEFCRARSAPQLSQELFQGMTIAHQKRFWDLSQLKKKFLETTFKRMVLEQSPHQTKPPMTLEREGKVEEPAYVITQGARHPVVEDRPSFRDTIDSAKQMFGEKQQLYVAVREEIRQNEIGSWGELRVPIAGLSRPTILGEKVNPSLVKWRECPKASSEVYPLVSKFQTGAPRPHEVVWVQRPAPQRAPPKAKRKSN